MEPVIGREKEISILEQVVASKQAEFVTVYGRRRIGKTYLIEQCLSNKGIFFECTGIKNGNMRTQLTNFIREFEATFYPGIKLQIPKNWHDAFELLTSEVQKISQNKNIIVVLDELPWLATRKSALLQNLDYFWNTKWSKLKNFKLIVCGSAASWILNNIINAKGGLHNRITKSMLLEPFTLKEAKQYLDFLKIKLTEKQILDVYMVMGGVPYYLKQIQKNKSLIQNIDEICFKKGGLLHEEFPRLFKSLFDAAELNLQIVYEIARFRYGVSFSELAKKITIKAGGRFQDRLNELEAAGFIQRFLPFDRTKRDNYYKIIDEYTLFYIKWISETVSAKTIPKTSNYWLRISKSPSWQSWAGYSFESICYKHVDHILKKLGLASMGCYVSTWKYMPNDGKKEQGAQIDLLLVRDDEAISICEIKYSSNPFIIDKACAKSLMNKLEVFQKQLKKPKELFLVLISAMGLKQNDWSDELINGGIVELKDLF